MRRKNDRMLLESLVRKYGKNSLLNEINKYEQLSDVEKIYYDLIDLRNEFHVNYASKLQRMGYGDDVNCIIDCYDSIIQYLKDDIKK